MKIHLRSESTDAVHTRFTVFIDGKNCGQLCLGTEDARRFYMIVYNGTHPELDTFVGSGRWNGDE